MGKYDSIALLMALLLPVISASAQVTKWQDYVRNKDVKWEGAIPVVPKGFTVDMGVGKVTGPGYTLEIARGPGGVVNVITDVIQSQPENGAGDDEKSINNYSLRRVHLEPGGTLRATTECQGRRTLSSKFAMLKAVFTKADLSLGNRRIADCHTVTPLLCSTLKRELASRFGKDYRTSKFGPACESYAKDLDKAFAAIVETLPKDLLESEKSDVEEILKQNMSGRPVFDYSSLNMTHLLASVSPEARRADARVGFGMFHDIMELEKQCERLVGRAAVSGGKAQRSQGSDEVSR